MCTSTNELIRFAPRWSKSSRARQPRGDGLVPLVYQRRSAHSHRAAKLITQCCCRWTRRAGRPVIGFTREQLGASSSMLDDVARRVPANGASSGVGGSTRARGRAAGLSSSAPQPAHHRPRRRTRSRMSATGSTAVALGGQQPGHPNSANTQKVRRVSGFENTQGVLLQWSPLVPICHICPDGDRAQPLMRKSRRPERCGALTPWAPAPRLKCLRIHILRAVGRLG